MFFCVPQSEGSALGLTVIMRRETESGFEKAVEIAYIFITHLPGYIGYIHGGIAEKEGRLGQALVLKKLGVGFSCFSFYFRYTFTLFEKGCIYHA